MISAIPPIPPIPPIGSSTPALPAASSGSAALQGNGASFQNLLGHAIDSLNATTSNATKLSLEAAAGQASAVDATVASTEAELATQLATALTSKALVSINSIMNMPV